MQPFKFFKHEEQELIDNFGKCILERNIEQKLKNSKFKTIDINTKLLPIDCQLYVSDTAEKCVELFNQTEKATPSIYTFNLRTLLINRERIIGDISIIDTDTGFKAILNKNKKEVVI